MSAINSTVFREPNHTLSECGLIAFLTDVDMESNDQINQFETTVTKIIEVLGNLVSSTSFTKDNIQVNAEKKVSLKMTIYLGGNPYLKNGDFQVWRMSNGQIFEAAKNIVVLQGFEPEQ